MVVKYSANDHAAFHTAINDGDVTARKVYADYLDENPGSAEPWVTHMLRHHDGRLSVRTGADGRPTLDFTKVVNPGVVDRRGLPTTIQYNDGRLSITGATGQSIMQFREYDPRGHLSIRDVKPRRGWTPKMIRGLHDVWDRWHLNEVPSDVLHFLATLPPPEQPRPRPTPKPTALSRRRVVVPKRYGRDEQAFHRSLVYDTRHGDLTPHLAYFDWLQEQPGMEKLAEALRRGVTEQAWCNGGVHSDSTTLGRDYPATYQSLGSVGELALGMAKPTRGSVVLSATPRVAFTDHAAENGSPFHYRVNLDANEAHDLADSLGGGPMKDYLRQRVLSDTRPRNPS